MWGKKRERAGHRNRAGWEAIKTHDRLYREKLYRKKGTEGRGENLKLKKAGN